MYNQFGNPYIVYDMHQTWVKSHTRKPRNRQSLSISHRLSRQIASTLLRIGEYATTWGEELQLRSQVQHRQPV